MELYEEKESFFDFIKKTAGYFKMPVEIVEKDYFVVLILKYILKTHEDIVFKGGTSLSKCFHKINRFSEDIDIALIKDKNSCSDREKLYKDIIDLCTELHFKVKNENEIKNRYKFNRFIIDYNTTFVSSYLNENVILECAFFINSFPIESKYISSYIYDYLNNIGRIDLVKKYNLEPYKINVQTLERTFIDKVFAICDYYLENDENSHSRHLYDLFMLYPSIIFNSNFKKLVIDVRNERIKDKKCVSASKDLNVLISEIIEKEFYKKDYKEVTEKLIKDNVSYESCVNTLKKIIKTNFFNDK